MRRRTDRKHDTSEMIDQVMGVYNNMYGEVGNDIPITRLPMILNFDLGNNQPKSYSLFENEPVFSTPIPKSIPQETKTSKQVPIGTKPNEKYGVKTLINTKSKMVYPFDKPVEQCVQSSNIKEPIALAKSDKSDATKELSESVPKKINDVDTSLCDDVEKYIVKEALSIKETFIEPELVTSTTHLGETTEKKKSAETVISTNQSGALGENFSDIENRMTKPGNTKKIDNKNDENIIVNTETKEEVVKNMETENVDVPQLDAKPIDSKQTVPVVEKKQNEEVTKHPEKEEPKWPELTIENIITTFKVVGDLREVSKLKIENDRYLTIDSSYIQSISRWRNDQGREKIISFLGHLLKETKRTINKVIEDIRNDIDVDANISIVEKLISRMSIFLHTYDLMKLAYKGDAGAYARLGAIRDEFYYFRGNLFRDILVPRNNK